MNTLDYKTKIEDLLKEPTYQPVSRDPTTYLEKTTKTKINSSPIDEITKKTLIPREKSSRCPKFYGLPKIHKPDTPLRPIVSAFNSPTQRLERYISQILQPITEKAPSYVRNSEHFTQILASTTVNKDDIIASFDIKSLYTNVPVNEALQLISGHENLPDHIIELARHCLSNSYFRYDGQIYRQRDGAAMGSSLSPAVANMFMIYFEEKAIRTYDKKPKLWLRYVDDIFVIWTHGREELQGFLEHLNTQHPKIEFTLEIEDNNQLPFLDVLVVKTKNGTVEHTVYRKPTHTNRYLQADSHHHPSQIQGVADTLISRSSRLTSATYKNSELKNIKTTLKSNGYSANNIRKAIRKQETTPPTRQENDTNKPRVILPYLKGTTDKIGRILRKKNISTSYKPHQTIRSILRNPKDKITLENQGVYSVACGNCHQSYVGQTNRRISVRVEEHKLAIRNKQLTSALFQHEHNTGHKINFKSCKQIANIENFKTRSIRESIEIEKQGLLNKRDDSLNLPKAWKSIIPKIPNNNQVDFTSQTAPVAPNNSETSQQNRYNLRRRNI